MDNNQSNNQWQVPQDPNQTQASSWATGGTMNGQTNPQVSSVNQSVQSPIGYQPPVSYGTLNIQSTQSTELPQQTPINNASMQNQPMGINNQPIQQNNFNQSTQQITNDINNGVGLNNQLAPQPAQVSQNATPQQSVDSKPKSISQNQILFIVTGLISLVALAVIVICVVLVVS